MPTSIVRVYNSNRGRYESNARVVLGWDGFVNLGHSSSVQTDGNGTAIVNHSATGTATVYINGRDCGTMRTPGETTISI